MKRSLWSLPLAFVAVASCGAPDLQTFEVTFKTVRNCHPAGIFAELCDDPASFRDKRRVGRVTLELRGPSDFILYEENGRAIPGKIDRGSYFARAAWAEDRADGCRKSFERTVRFTVTRDELPALPNRPAVRDHLDGNSEDRSSQNGVCGQDVRSRLEETFSGDDVVDPNVAPTLSLPGSAS